MADNPGRESSDDKSSGGRRVRKPQPVTNRGPRVTAGTAYTFEFLQRRLPFQARNVLDIGCGDGELSALLLSQGIDVVALDHDRDAVRRARSRGIDVLRADWPCTLDRRFDVVIFGRSLHHMNDLDDALAAADCVLRQGGMILVEDFCSELASGAGIAWYGAAIRLLGDLGHISGGVDPDEAVAELRRLAADSYIHSCKDMRAALRSQFVVDEYGAAYYFRFLASLTRNLRASESLLRHELAMIEGGLLEPLGRRFAGLKC